MGQASEFATVVSALVPAAACVWAGVHHACAPAGLARALRQLPSMRHRLRPGAASLLARGWGAVEAGTGIAVAAAFLGPAAGSVRLWLLGWLALMYGGFGAWLAILWRRLPGAACGCGARADPADGPALLRAGLLGAGAVSALLFMLVGEPPGMAPHAWAALPMAATLALLIWILPASMRTLEAR